MNNFKFLINNIKANLQNALPGFEAHKILAPSNRQDLINKSNQNSRKISAVLILLYPDNDKIYIPLIRKQTNNGVHSGQISFPGGKYESGDLTTDITAIRETEEEIGVDRNDITILGKLSNIYIPVSNFQVEPYIGYINYKPDFIAQPQEVDEIINIEFHEIINHKLETKEIQTSAFTVDAPFMVFDKTQIWGATAMILYEFYMVVSEIYQNNEK